MKNFLSLAYFQNQFIPIEQAQVSIATHALHYGTAALGGLRVIPNSQNPSEILLFRLDQHCQRLSNSAKYLHYDLPADKIEQLINLKNNLRQLQKIKPLNIKTGLLSLSFQQINKCSLLTSFIYSSLPIEAISNRRDKRKA